MFSTALAAVLLTAAPSTCPLSQSVYRDVNGQGFALVWGEAIADLASSKATLQISYDGERLYHWSLTQASGYGTISLGSLDSDPLTTALTLTFFDSELADATPRFFEAELPAPTYAFIAGLGRDDYYERRGEDPLVGETLWRFDHCQS
jgi:hypothetical protein